MAKQCRLCGGVAELCGKNIYGEDVYKCRTCKETGHHSRFKEINSTDEREKLICSLVISVFINACKGIKTETLKKVKELIEADEMAYYYDGGE